MNDGQALLATIIQQPDEDTPRLVFADWLEEQGQGLRAEFIRLSVERATLKPRPLIVGSVTNLDDHGMITVESFTSFAGTTTLIDVCDSDSRRMTTFHGCEVLELMSVPGTEQIENETGGWIGAIHRGTFWRMRAQVTGEKCPIRARCDLIQKRIVELHSLTSLCEPVKFSWFTELYNHDSVMRQARLVGHTSSACLKRGLAESLECTAEEWCEIHSALVWHPDQKVKCPFGCDKGWHENSGSSGDWKCKGCVDGFSPRPCPITAHPIRRVRLTSHTGLPLEGVVPDMEMDSFRRLTGYDNPKPFLPIPQFAGLEFYSSAWSNEMWPGIKFQLHRNGIPADQGRELDVEEDDVLE